MWISLRPTESIHIVVSEIIPLSRILIRIDNPNSQTQLVVLFSDIFAPYNRLYIKTDGQILSFRFGFFNNFAFMTIVPYVSTGGYTPWRKILLTPSWKIFYPPPPPPGRSEPAHVWIIPYLNTYFTGRCRMLSSPTFRDRIFSRWSSPWQSLGHQGWKIGLDRFWTLRWCPASRHQDHDQGHCSSHAGIFDGKIEVFSSYSCLLYFWYCPTLTSFIHSFIATTFSKRLLNKL